MKKFLFKFIAILVIGISSSLFADAQVVVKIRPGAPVLRARPFRPGPRHIWINGEYVMRGNDYVYTDGYWAVPPPRYHYWKEGHWKNARNGWIWIPGHWK